MSLFICLYKEYVLTNAVRVNVWLTVVVWLTHFSLQVSHHPPVSAFYVSNRKDGFCLSGSILAKSKFYGTDTRPVIHLCCF